MLEIILPSLTNFWRNQIFVEISGYGGEEGGRIHSQPHHHQHQLHQTSHGSAQDPKWFFPSVEMGRGGDWLTPPSSTGIGLIEKLLLDLNWKDHLIKHFWVLFYCRFRKNFVFYLDVRKTYELYWLICEFAVADLLEFKKILF